MKHEKQGTNSVPKTKKEVNLTAEQLRALTPQERIEYAKRKNGKQPTIQNGIVLDKSTVKKIEAENKLKAVNQATPKTDTKKSKKSKKNETKQSDNHFAKAVEDFEKMYIENGYSIPSNDTTLHTLSKAIAFSVIKKLIQVSADKVMIQMRNETVRNINLLDNLAYYTINGTSAHYDKNGNIKCEIIDEEYNKAVKEVLADSISQGMDIVNQATLLIIAELETILSKSDNKPLTIGFMGEPYESRKTNGKTFVVNGKKSVEWSTVEIIPIVNVFRGVRQYIQGNKSIKALTNGYSYIESLSFDSESDEVEKIYYRLQKYADLGSAVHDFNGKETAYTTDENGYKEYKKSLANLIDKGNLSQKHIDFIQCRLCGKSLKDTADKIGISLRSVERLQAELQIIAVSVGYGTDEMLPKAENQSKSKPIIAIDKNGKHYTFDSVKSASVTLAVDRSNITAVLKGRLKATKGYTFEYTE